MTIELPKQTTATQLGPNAVAPLAEHTADDEGDLVFHDIPPFPDDEPVAPLLRLNLKKIIDNDPAEVDRLWRASCDVGFFYLDCRDAIDDGKHDSAQDLTNGAAKPGVINGAALLKDVDALYDISDAVFDISNEEKDKYNMKKNGTYFGFKPLGQGIVDAKGRRDRSEFWNISKDDMCGISDPLPKPQILQETQNRDVMKSFVLQSEAIMDLLFKRLNDRLGLPPQTLQNKHRLDALSGNHMRWLKMMPQPENDRQRSVGEHTDFGSLTILFNRMGGLQLLPPDSEQWCYVKPLKGHCVCNLGDAMVVFSAGILRSNIHRVINPPGQQADSTRISLGYFSRPEDEVIMKVLEGSDLIDKNRKLQGNSGPEENITANEWIMKRALGRAHGQGDWKDGLGTEGNRQSKE